MSFDLNIKNYSRDELIEMFNLPQNFDRNIFEINETKLKDNIINNREITKETQNETLNFILKAKNIILNENIIQKQNKGVVSHSLKKITDFYNTSYDLKSIKLDDPQEHMVQIRDNKPYLSSYPSEFFNGVINPLKKRTITKNVSIDSRFRENYYTYSSSNYNINMPTNINNVVKMQLSAIEIPTTYYLISKQYGNNFFSISVNGSSNVINIPDGNYDQTSIMNAINKELSLLGSPFNEVCFTISLTSSTTGSGQTLVGFTNLAGITSLELNFQADKYGIDDIDTPLPLKFGWILGFRNGIYINNLNYVSEGIVDTKGPKYLFLVLDDYKNSVNNDNFTSVFNSSLLSKNILARISLQQNLFNTLEQNNLNLITSPREYFGPVDLQVFNIQLLDEYGRIVDLNNMDFSFCITLTLIYDL